MNINHLMMTKVIIFVDDVMNIKHLMMRRVIMFVDDVISCFPPEGLVNKDFLKDVLVGKK